jgi:hypothetical protein
MKFKIKKSLLEQSIVLLFGQVQQKRLRFCHKELTLLLYVLLYTRCYIVDVFTHEQSRVK